MLQLLFITRTHSSQNHGSCSLHAVSLRGCGLGDQGLQALATVFSALIYNRFCLLMSRFRC